MKGFDNPYFELFTWAILSSRKDLALYFLELSRVSCSHIDLLFLHVYFLLEY